MKNIVYTKGPDELWLGDLRLERNIPAPVSDELAAQALLPARVDEFGFTEAPSGSVPARSSINEEGE